MDVETCSARENAVASPAAILRVCFAMPLEACMGNEQSVTAGTLFACIRSAFPVIATVICNVGITASLQSMRTHVNSQIGWEIEAS